MTYFLASLMYPMDVLCSLIRSNCRSLTGLSFLYMALPCSLCVYYSSLLLSRPTLRTPYCSGGGWGCPWGLRRPCHHESSPRLVQLEPGRQRHGAVQNTVGIWQQHCSALHAMFRKAFLSPDAKLQEKEPSLHCLGAMVQTNAWAL